MVKEKQFGWDGGQAIYPMQGGLPVVPTGDSYGKFLRSLERRKQPNVDVQSGSCFPTRRKRQSGPA